MKVLSIHYITNYYKKYNKIKIQTNICYIRHTRRVYPWLLSGIKTNWSISKQDKRIEIIQNNVENIRRKLNIIKPKE